MFGTSTFAGSPFASLAGAIYNSAVSETGVATDVVGSTQTFISLIAETGTSTDVGLVAPSIFNVPVLETGTATDAAFGRVVYLSSVTETGAATDAVSSKQTFISTIVETGAATDAVSSKQTFASFIAELATVTDSLSCRLLWELIDDSQTANWARVSTGVVATGMDGVFGGAAFSAAPFAGLVWGYTLDSGWVGVAVNPATNWQIIGTVN